MENKYFLFAVKLEDYPMIDCDIDLPPIGGKQGSSRRQRVRRFCGPIPIALHILTQIVWPLDDAPHLEVQSAEKSARTKSFR